MALTMKREKLLNIIGLKSLGSAAREIVIRAEVESRSAFRDLNFFDKLRSAPKRIVKRVVRELNWRHFIQHRFDRIIPYAKYSLPNSVYRNDELARKNDSFIKTFE